MRVKDIVSKFIAEGEAPYYITMQGGKPMVKSGNGLTPVEPSKLWFELTPDVWSIDGGHLTPTMKMKRREILNKYKILHQNIYKK